MAARFVVAREIPESAIEGLFANNNNNKLG